jgi:hypothetical protein
MLKWGMVRVATLSAIWEQLQRMTAPIAARAPENKYAVAYEASIKLMDEVSEWIQTQVLPAATDDGDLGEYEEQKADMSALHRDVARDYVYVRDVLTPRVLELANDARLTELLFALDAAERRWSDFVALAGPGETQSGWPRFALDAWTAVGDFYSSATRVARYVAATPDLPDPSGLEIVRVTDGDRGYYRTRMISDQT